MKKLLVIIMMASFVIALAPIQIAADDFSSRVIEKVKDSVMMVRGPTSYGSGVVVGKKTMLTAYHVVENRSGSDELSLILVTDRYGNKYKAEVLATDKDNDVALLVLLEKEFSAKPVKIDRLYDVGDQVFSVGYNLAGFESYGGEYIPEESITEFPVPRVGYGHINDIRPSLVYIDIGCYSYGSSGGGTFDEGGRLIGINSLVLTDGAGKIGIIRPYKILTLTVLGEETVVDLDGKKKIADFTDDDKHMAIRQHVIGTTGQPRYAHPRSGERFWIKIIPLSKDWQDPAKVDPDAYKRWCDARYPDIHRLEIHAGEYHSLYITEIRMWKHDGGTERMYINYKVYIDVKWWKDDDGNFHTERGDIKIAYGYLEGSNKVYIVCDNDNIIMNMHGPDWVSPFTEEEAEKELPKARAWFDLLWETYLLPHYRGE